ncbi:class II aldolase/adducin family protein [Nonomuraea sp. NPDC002799]
MDELFTPPTDRWDAGTARRLSGRDEVLYRSRLVGSDPSLTKEGGGNFSAKGVAADRRGRTTSVLYMSAWGCDGATTTPDDFPALRLDDLLALRDSGPLTETEMIGHLIDSGLSGEQRRPGIETLTHAFIPARHVDHCHPDAVIALTSFPGGRQAAEDEFGEEAVWFDYRQFDAGVARELAGRIAARPGCRFVLLANHGLFTWSDSSEQCYRNSLEAVERATRAVRKAIWRPADLGGPAVSPLPPEAADGLLAELLPAIRGALSYGTASNGTPSDGTLSDGTPADGSLSDGAPAGDAPAGGGRAVVLHLDRSGDAVSFASSERGPQWTQAGPSCPDHLVTVGYRPLVLDRVPAGPAEVLAAIQDHRDRYDAYYERHMPEPARALGKRGNAPRAIVLPGLGTVTCGPDAAKARLYADHLAQTMTVVRAADAAGGYRTLTEAQGAADEYWPLMRLKPQLRAEEGPLAGAVFLITAAGAHADAVAERLAAAGAHVALAAPPERREAATATAATITGRHGERRAVPVILGTAESAVHETLLTYGGVDAVIDDSPDAGLARAALPVFARQGRPGTLLLTRAKPASGEQRHGHGLDSADASCHIIVAADADAVARAAIFLAGSGGTSWRSTTLTATSTRGNP